MLERSPADTAPKVLVTGARGFVGRACVQQLRARGIAVTAVARGAAGTADTTAPKPLLVVADYADLAPHLRGHSCVVHLAARVHVMHETTRDALHEFRRANVHTTLQLARLAAAAGVRRFVFLSSVKVHGEATDLDRPYREDDVPMPQDAYGISKLEAEQGLHLIAQDTGMEVVVIRPPLVYGPGVRANFLSLMRAIERGWPLPLGAINNRRSLLGLDNLVDFIATCIIHPQAANQTFLVSDGQDVSTPELIRSMAQALGCPARLLPVPAWLLQWGAKLLGRRAMAQRVCGSLQVDISKARQLLAWQPPFTLAQGLKKMTEGNSRETPI